MVTFFSSFPPLSLSTLSTSTEPSIFSLSFSSSWARRSSRRLANSACLSFTRLVSSMRSAGLEKAAVSSVALNESMADLCLNDLHASSLCLHFSFIAFSFSTTCLEKRAVKSACACLLLKRMALAAAERSSTILSHTPSLSCAISFSENRSLDSSSCALSLLSSSSVSRSPYSPLPNSSRSSSSPFISRQIFSTTVMGMAPSCSSSSCSNSMRMALSLSLHFSRKLRVISPTLSSMSLHILFHSSL
mmetsp:Transcript_39919/g.102944  ORF Transcript_39919/g.102944 Transcript_39919/m.102944 type:complete len:246 (+) Transcript_39919:6755-7492(+)